MQGSPTPEPGTTTGPGPVRNRAAWQEVSGGPVSKASSAAPHPWHHCLNRPLPPTPSVEELSSTKPVPGAKKRGTAALQDLAPLTPWSYLLLRSLLTCSSHTGLFPIPWTPRHTAAVGFLHLTFLFPVVTSPRHLQGSLPHFIQSLSRWFLLNETDEIKFILGLPWWRSGWESACQCRGHGSSPGLGRSHMPRSSWAHEPQLLSLHVWSLCSATREAATVRGPCTAMKSGPCSPQLEKALTQKRRPSTAKNK